MFICEIIFILSIIPHYLLKNSWQRISYFHVEIFWPSVHGHEAFIFKDKGVIADEKEFAQSLLGILKS